MQITWHRPDLYPEQLAAIYDPARYSVIEASTKSGKTVGCMAWIVEGALTDPPGAVSRWIAPRYKVAKIAYRRVKKWCDAFFPPELWTAKESDEVVIEFPGHGRIEFWSGEKPDDLYGEDCERVVCDECSRMREEVLPAVRSTLTKTRGPARFIGNVKGRRNWFYRMARRAESGQKNHAYHRITWRAAVEAGVLDGQEIEDARAEFEAMGKLAIFLELYETEASDDEGNPFGFETIKACTLEKLSNEPARVFGVDLAKSVDWTVILGLDAWGATSHFERFQRPWEWTTANVRTKVGGRPALVDATGVGDPILERLQRDGRNFEGFKFTSTSKQQLMEGLAAAMSEGSVGFPPGQIVTELEAFEYEYTRTGVRYTAPDGMHDDCVDALALAVKAMRKPHGAVIKSATFR